MSKLPTSEQAATAATITGTINRADLDEYFNAALSAQHVELGQKALRMFAKLAPNDAHCAYLNGIMLQHANRIPEALDFHVKAVELDDNTVDYLYHLGGVLCQMQRFEEAKGYFQEVVKREPNNAMAWYHLGGIFLKTQRLMPAEHAYRHTLRLKPDFAFAHYGLACVLLQRNKWTEGWSEFEWRWKSPEMFGLIASRMPLWQGQALAGRRIVVVAEQGHGDTIQFARYLKQLQKMGADIHLWAPFETVVLLSRIPEVRNSNMWGRNIPDADFYIPLLSLPNVLQARPETIPAAPYLNVNPARRRDFQALLGPRYERLRIGIAWAGNPTNPDDPTRSAALSELAPLFNDQNIRWISLQKGLTPMDGSSPHPRVEDWNEHIESFDDSAALISALDGVVSICSAPLHLAGALGVPTLALLSSSPDWRWGEQLTKTQWYGNMTLVRQAKPGDWRNVAARARIYLAGWRQRPQADERGRNVPTITGEYSKQDQPTNPMAN